MFSSFEIDKINAFNKGTMLEFLEMECVEVGIDFLKFKMPVSPKTVQPMRLLHGGASAALIESVGSVGSALLCDLKKEYPVGLEINANHIRGLKEGFVIATGKIIHKGRKTHVWQVDLHDDQLGKLICTGRLTVMINQIES